MPDLRLYLLRHLSFITKNGPCLQLRSVLSHLPAHRRVGAQRPCFHFQLSFSVQTDTALLNSILSKPLWVSCEFYTVFLRVPERHIHHSFQDMPVCTLDRSDCCGMTPLGLLESVSGWKSYLGTSSNFSEVLAKILWPHPWFNVYLESVFYFETLLLTGDTRNGKSFYFLNKNVLAFLYFL